MRERERHELKVDNMIQTRMIFASTSPMPTDKLFGHSCDISFPSPSVTSLSSSSTESETLGEDRESEEPWEPCSDKDASRWQEGKK